MKNFILRFLHQSPKLYRLLRSYLSQDVQSHLLAKMLINQIQGRGVLDDIQQAEFKVFSQFGDDGIIQYLINLVKLPPEERNFVEVGVEDYTEANTRFLLVNNNWSGLVVDAGREEIEFIKKEDIYWKYDLTAVCSFVTKSNINNLLDRHLRYKKIGLLSIDIDGNDYWIWEAITLIKPRIVIMEYNGLFGQEKSVSIPYQEDFSRIKAHYSTVYWGCSLKSLVELGRKKGYHFVGTNTPWISPCFVRKDSLGKVKPISLKKGFTLPKYRESRDREGRLTFVSGENRLKLIKSQPLYDFEKCKQLLIKNIYNL